jgi:hypothetical protein
MSPSKLNFKNGKMLTGTDAATLSKKKLFRKELDHRFGFTPFYGTVSCKKSRPTSTIFFQKEHSLVIFALPCEFGFNL